MKKNIKKTVCVAVALVLQCAAIGWLIGRYENIVRNGTEVRFPCTAYDPYDPLRGRYLQATVRETCTNLTGLAVTDDNHWEYGDRLYAKFEPSTNGLWRVAAVALEPKDDGGVWIKPMPSRIERLNGWPDRREGESSDDFAKRRGESPYCARINLPDRLFVNERVAPDAEDVLRKATAAGGKGAVAVYRVKNFEIVITDIEIDGRPIAKFVREANSAR